MAVLVNQPWLQDIVKVFTRQHIKKPLVRYFFHFCLVTTSLVLPHPPLSPVRSIFLITGVDFLEKTIDLDAGESVKLMIWDTAGQEEFDSLTASYYRGTGACAIVFSTIDRNSFEAVEKWKRKIEAECGNSVVMCLVQNKVSVHCQTLDYRRWLCVNEGMS